MVVRDGWSKMKYHVAFVLQMLIICTSLYASKFFRQSLPDWFESHWLRKEPPHSFAKYLWRYSENKFYLNEFINLINEKKKLKNKKFFSNNETRLEAKIT